MVGGGSDSQGQNGKPPLTDAELQGRVLNGRFHLMEPLGQGGMGKVFKAIQAPLDRIVAVKVLSPNFPSAKDPGFEKRFLREASLTSKLRHPNTVTVIDYGQTDDGIYYIAMEFLEGHTLSQELARHGSLPYPRALHITQQICRSLREAHRLGVIHRDLKPANVMLMTDHDQDLVKVLDFGLVKSFLPDAPGQEVNPEITQNGTFLGSPQYMAPEQARNVSDPRSDVYSLGVLLYQMLTGRPPFIGRDYLELIFQHLKEQPPRFKQVRPDIDIPPSVEAVVFRCLSKDPAERYQSMDELLEAMRMSVSGSGLSGVFQASTLGYGTGQFQTMNPVVTTPPPTPTPSTDAIEIHLDEEVADGRRKYIVPAAVVGGSLLLGFLAVLLVGGPTQPAAPATAAAVPAQAQKPAAPQVPVNVRFRIDSIPSGAQLFLKDQPIGVTPAVLELPGNDKGVATAEFTFSLEGYHPLTLVAGGAGEVVLTQPLQQKTEPRRVGAARVQGGRAVERSATAASPSEERPAEYSMGSLEPAMAFEDDVVPSAPIAEEKPAAVAAPAPTPAVAKSSAQAVPASTGGAMAESDELLRFTEGMRRPRPVSRPLPVYTPSARDARVQGMMVIKCVITTRGAVENCRVLKTVPVMERVVLETIAQWRYRPYVYEGKIHPLEYVFNIKLTPN